MTASEDQLYREISVVAFHFHWSFHEILDLDHLRRRRFVHEITRLVREG